jgi:ubiquinone/menaquinone biosynthesis C-methylase UbiE
VTQRARSLDVNIESATQMKEYETIVRRIADDQPGPILDWGCGWGQVTHLLRERGLDATAFDYSPGVPEGTVAPLPRYPQIEAHLGPDPVKLPFPTSSFGAVLSCGVLEHVARPEASLEEIRRVLRPGGIFYVFKLPNRASYLEWIARRLGLYYHGAAEHDAVYSLESAVELLAGHGFEVVEGRRANMLPLTLTGRIANRVSPLLWTGNRALAAVPGLNRLATNIEVVARSTA